MNKTTYIALIVLGLLFGSIIAYAITNYQIPTTGNIVAPSNLQFTPAIIKWGTFVLTQNDTSKQYLTITNTGDLPTTALQISATPNVGTLFENVTGTVIQPHSSIIGNFTLLITATTVQPIDFPINIGA